MRRCFDGADFSACPLCHRRLDPGDPLLRPAPVRPKRSLLRRWRGVRALPGRRRVLHPGGDLAADTAQELAALLARPAALSPADTDDLTAPLDLQPREDLSWCPPSCPVERRRRTTRRQALRSSRSGSR